MLPADFSKPSFFEVTLLGLIGVVCFRGLTLSVPRILLLLGLIWMALCHIRNIEVFAFLAPLVLAKPIAEQWGMAGSAPPARARTLYPRRHDRGSHRDRDQSVGDDDDVRRAARVQIPAGILARCRGRRP